MKRLQHFFKKYTPTKYDFQHKQSKAFFKILILAAAISGIIATIGLVLYLALIVAMFLIKVAIAVFLISFVMRLLGAGIKIGYKEQQKKEKYFHENGKYY
jgi:hypothetical protein